MTDAYDITVTVLRILGDVLRKLKPDQVEQLADGKASLVFLPPGASIVIAGPEATEVREQLSTAQSRQEAAAYLEGLKLRKPGLVSLARQLDIAVASKDTMDVIKRKVIRGTFGAREDASAILSGSWKT